MIPMVRENLPRKKSFSKDLNGDYLRTKTERSVLGKA